MDRTFGTFNQGSLRIATFTLFTTAVGVGMLALTQAIANLGYVIGVGMLFVGAFNLYIGLYCFKYLMYKYPKAKIYSEIVG